MDFEFTDNSNTSAVVTGSIDFYPGSSGVFLEFGNDNSLYDLENGPEEFDAGDADNVDDIQDFDTILTITMTVPLPTVVTPGVFEVVVNTTGYNRETYVRLVYSPSESGVRMISPPVALRDDTEDTLLVLERLYAQKDTDSEISWMWIGIISGGVSIVFLAVCGGDLRRLLCARGSSFVIPKAQPRPPGQKYYYTSVDPLQSRSSGNPASTPSQPPAVSSVRVGGPPVVDQPTMVGSRTRERASDTKRSRSVGLRGRGRRLPY